jgi:hypothetical protein
MLTAGEARNKARQDRIIFDEIRSIESSILDAIEAGSYETTVSSGTHMTDIATGIPYYATWAGASADRAKATQMDSVIAYFANIGYAIERRLNSITGETITWYVAW